MSAEAFRAIAKNIPELKYWGSGQQDTTSILHQTRDTSKSFIDKTLVEHVIPFEQLSDIIGKTNAKIVFDEVKAGKYIGELENVSYMNSAGQETITFHQVKFGYLNEYVSDYLASIVNNVNAGTLDKKDILGYVKTNKLEKGHVYGWSNTLINRVKESAGSTIRSQNKSVEEIELELDTLDKFIDSLLVLLEEYDEASTHIKSIKSPVFAKYRKTSTNWLTTWEIKSHNLSTGTAVGQALGRENTGIRAFLKNAAAGTVSLAQAAIGSITQGFVKQGLAASGSQSLLNMESSPSLLKMIEDDIVSAILGKPKTLAKTYTGEVKVVDISLRKVDNTKSKQSVLKTKSNLLKLKSKIAATKPKIHAKVQSAVTGISLASLQILLNRHLQDVVSANMGDGNSRNVLNYRTGRFAESAKVERLTQSKEGMITAFYSYMKNPYGTFSEGGKQQYPKTRDPKLLISKSIKEIAMEAAVTRMRAVVV